jgi:hypothetical protein
MRNKAVYRKELPRIYELRDLLPNPLPPGAYFRDLDKTLAKWPQKREQFRHIEGDLQGLDAAAWAYLKAEVAPLLAAKHKMRGWQPLFDKLNQAKAFNYLVRIGYADVHFIPESSVKGQQTPDLGAIAEKQKVLCEVKTINISEVEACRQYNQGVGTVTDQLDDGFLRKLISDLTQAKKQMLAYDPASATKKMVYIIPNFDDRLHEYVDRYQVQIDRFMVSSAIPELEVVFDIKPAFYAAQC